MDWQALKNILKLLAIIGICISIFFLIPIGTGYLYDENVFLFLSFDAAFFLINALLYLVLRSHVITLTIRESIFSVNFIWILVGFAGGIPLWLYTKITFMQAVFESISGFTTTGATIYPDVEILPHSVIILRSLMHWLGGMGILVLGIGLFSVINPSGSLALFKSESSGLKLDKSRPKIKDTAIMLWGIYVLLTFLDALLLRIGGMNTFDAINHAFSTISTGGFSTNNNSFGSYDNPFILWTTTFFMIISGITFLYHFRALKGDFDGYKNEDTLWYILIFILLTVIMASIHYETSTDTLWIVLTHAAFNIASLMTSTGFASQDYETWGQAAIAVAVLAMLASANVGSTAGGVKFIRYIVSVKVVVSELRKILHPNAFISVFVNGTVVSEAIVSMTFGFILLYIMTNTAIIFYLYASNYDAMTAVSAAIACVGNIGPGFGLIGPSHNYAFFDNIDLFVLCIGMIMGRLEIFTFLLIFVPSFWKKY